MTPADVTDDDLIVDNTILSATATCHTRVALRHGLGLTSKSESAAIISGQYAHEVLAWWMCGKSPEESLARLDGYARWIADHGGVGDDDRLAYSNVRRILKRWFQLNTREKFPYVVNPADVEVPMVAELGVINATGQRIIMVALLDALVKSKTGGRWTMDHKTTKTVNDFFKDDLDDAAQFTGQLWIAEENGQPLAGVVINALEFKKIPDSDRKCSTHSSKYKECGISHVTLERFTATRTPSELVSWAKTALKLARTFARIKAQVEADPLAVTTLPMQGRFNYGACKNCEFREWCSMGRPKGSLRTFTEQRWNPLERAKEHAEALGVIR